MPFSTCPRLRQAPTFALATVAALLTAAALGASPLRAAATAAAEVRALAGAGQLVDALARADRALQQDPRDVQLRFVRGVVLMDLQRDDDALAVFTQLMQEYPELPDPPNNAALLHARAGRLDQALASLEQALRNDPGHRTARANLGQVHLMLAVRAWEQAAAQGPLDAPLQRRLEGARALLAATR